MTIHIGQWPDDPPSADDVGADGTGELRLDERAIWSGEDLHWEHLVEVARQLGPDPAFADLDDSDLEQRVRNQAAEIAASTCRYLQLLAELVVRGIWADQGARTPADWLSWAIGLGPSTARDHVRIALRLRDLPRITERFAAGTLSFSKVRALTRVATPDLEQMLLMWADHATAAQIEGLIRGWRRSRRALRAGRADLEERESVDSRFDENGDMLIVIRTTPDRGAELLERLRRIVEVAEAASAEAAGGDTEPALPLPEDTEPTPPQPDREAVEDGPIDYVAVRRRRGERMVDALLDALALASEDDAGDTTGADRHTLVLQAPADALAGGDDPRPIVPVEGPRRRLPSMSPATLRRLACDAGIVLVATDERGTPIDVGRRHRRLTPALRRALRLRDASCRFPGCSASRHLHAHHVVHWADGGPTDLANLVLICSHHHRVVHEEGWTVTGDGTGRFSFAPPGGEPVTRSLPLGPASAEAATDRIAVEPSRDPLSLQPVRWDGPGSVDYDMAVAVIHQELSRVLPEVPAAA